MDKINTQLKGAFYFDPGDKIYSNHFPGCPIVPGSLIVEAFIKAAEKMNDSSRRFSVENFRFRHFIIPGEYNYSLTKENNMIKCALYLNNKAVVTGRLK